MTTTGRVVPWVVGLALALAGTAIVAVTPAPDEVDDAFVIPGASDETVRSRALTARVEDVSFADGIRDAEWRSEGNWLVVTLTASVPVTEVDASIGLATLVADGRTFQSTERTTAQLTDADLRIGVDTVGMLAFELPADLRSGTAQLRLTSSRSTPDLDDVISITLELDDVPRTEALDIDEPAWKGTP